MHSHATTTHIQFCRQPEINDKGRVIQMQKHANAETNVNFGYGSTSTVISIMNQIKTQKGRR